MGFLDKLRASMARLMSGRYGADQLSMAMVIAALVVSILGTFTGARAVAMVLSDALLIVAFFRMFSKDRYRRAHENEVYLSKTEGARRGFTEWLNRVKNGKKYRYFTCPKCKRRLRVPRGVGSVTVTCKNCGAKFDKKRKQQRSCHGENERQLLLLSVRQPKGGMS